MSWDQQSQNKMHITFFFSLLHPWLEKSALCTACIMYLYNFLIFLLFVLMALIPEVFALEMEGLQLSQHRWEIKAL